MRIEALITGGILLASMGCGKHQQRVDTRENEFLLISKERDRATNGSDQALLRFFVEDRLVGSAELLWGEFERPLLFLPGYERGEFVCIYDFDVGLRVLTFGGRQTPQVETAFSDLGQVVTQATTPVRSATPDEVEFARSQVSSLSDARLKAASIPTLRVGVFRLYPQRAQVVERLDQLIAENRTR